MNDEAMPDDRTALLVAARVLEAIRPYCLLELTTRYPVSQDGRRLGAFTIDEALDLADAALAGREARR
ncbi:hypothetical protein KL86PLE_90412 [uncultured Pleomorphomonas sp.]|uniref:Uncharacterized protein n=1 Tax=uncultured Pleomorphomonas sp. TaxID=442121 RepID=A0A212LPG1_9HYPH|nr:hypothetical protein [uncultured Pleomorphomonas sp.]SCM79458.1 hypothetical protein KL86PLE_90412 [uncultured Pleomorphomonas sp.]